MESIRESMQQNQIVDKMFHLFEHNVDLRDKIKMKIKKKIFQNEKNLVEMLNQSNENRDNVMTMNNNTN